jgi:sulfate transport system substrate-binding protein
VIPNPKTSGNGRYSYLAAWAYALRQSSGDEVKAKAFVTKLFANVPVLDTGGRGATTTFAQREIGDVLLTFENEIHLTIREFAAAGFEAVVPTVSILAENPVAVVDKVTAKRGTTAVAQAYLEYLYSEAGQELAAKHFVRPSDPAILAKHKDSFPAIELVTVDAVFGGFAKAQATHFADSGVFDQIYQPK